MHFDLTIVCALPTPKMSVITNTGCYNFLLNARFFLQIKLRYLISPEKNNILIVKTLNA